MLNAATGELLNYNLYTNSARTTIWGDGSAGTSRLTNIIWSGGSSFTRTIYGRIPAGQDVGVGNYGDILVITISF
jgi:spore coat protein U-like protein